MEEKPLKNKNYKYLLSLKNSNENKIIEILKEQENIKEYIVQAIQYFEQGKKTVQGDAEFRKNVENKLNKMEGILDQINRNTGM